MESHKRYSGRLFGPQEVERVREIIRTHPEASRQQLSYRVCEAFDWRKPDGSLKDMSCRVALLRMHREGLIELPAPRRKVAPCRSFTRPPRRSGKQTHLCSSKRTLYLRSRLLSGAKR
jgi:hypothetical protein